MNHVITKVISGGQTGADQGGIYGAAKAGIETGGWMPFGFMTENGPNPEFAAKYGLKECEDQGSDSKNYSIRTGRNVFDSDGTIRIAADFSTRGEVCTKNAIGRHGKSFLDIKFDRIEPHSVKYILEHFKDWVDSNNIRTLNVAGNCESNAPGIAKYTESLIYELIKAVNHAT